MIPNLADIAVSVSASVEFSLLVKATLLLGAGLAAARLAAHARASVRHVILAAAFAAVLALPLFATARLDVPVAGVTRDATAGGAPAPAAAVEPRSAQPSRSEPAAAPAARPRGWPSSLRLPWVGVARATWAAGTALMLAQLASVCLRLRRLRRTAIPRPDLRAAVRSLAADAGVRRQVDVVTHEEAPLPFTFGLRRPVIVLPPDAASWDEDDVRRTLVHELEHVRRGDWAAQMAVRLECAALWFHPLAWAAWRRLCLAAERACDDAVVGREEGANYAEQLVLLARRLSPTQPQAVPGMANRSDLSARVAALLDERQPRGQAGALTLGAAVAAALTLLLAVAPLRAVPAPGGRARGGDGIESQARRARSLDRALYEAARRGDTDEVLDLLGQGANPNASLPGDGSPLIGAVRSGKPALVALLLDRGASPDLGVPGDGTALIAAAAAGRLEIVELLLERGAGPDVNVRGDGSPLIAAARRGRHDVVTRLLDRGADIELVVPGDENALIQAAGGGHLEVVKTLVQRGANVNARVWAEGAGSREGEWRTPLGMARRGRHTAVVEFLAASGARE